MDLVAGYGSDSSGGSPSTSAAPPAVPAVAPALPTWASAKDTASSDGLLTRLPAPSNQPKRKKRKTLPMTVQHVPDSDEEDQPKRKVHVSSKGKSLTEFLPAPKQLDLAASGAGRTLSRRAASPDSSPDHLMTEGMPESTLRVEEEISYPAEVGNEAYRLEQQAEDDDAELDQHTGAYSNGAMPPHALAARGQPQQQHDLLEQTLAEEMAKSARRSGTASTVPPGVQFKQANKTDLTLVNPAQKGSAGRARTSLWTEYELQLRKVNQTDLTYVNPAQREAAGGARTALGTEYELQLRREAGPKPGKQANRKHQISSLYHQSRIRELEDLERRGQGIKTKMETQAKYGW